MKDKDVEVIVTPEVLADLEAHPELVAFYREASARIQQAVAEFNAGKFKTMDEAMRSIGATPLDEQPEQIDDE